MKALFQKLQTAWLLYQFKRPLQLAFLRVYFRLTMEGTGPGHVLEKMEKAKDPQWQIIARDVRLRIAAKRSVSDALRIYFDADICDALRAPEGLKDQSRISLETIKRFKQQAANKWIWLPIVLKPTAFIVMLLVAYTILALEFFPAVAALVEMPTTGIEYWVSVIGTTLIVWWPLALFVITALPLGTVYSLPRWGGDLRVAVDQKAPFSLYREVVAARLEFQLCVLLGAGNDLKTAIEILLSSAPTHTKTYLLKMKALVPEGNNYAPILDVGLLNDWDINELEMLAGTKGFSSALETLSEESQIRAEERLLLAAKKAQFFMYIILGAMVFGLLSAIISPTTQMLNSTGAY